MAKIKAIKNVQDGWSNVLTKLGVLNKDKRTGARVDKCYLDRDTLEALYQADDISQRIVDIVPEEMTREGYEINVPENAELEDELKMINEELHIDDMLTEAVRLSRLYGGSAILLGVEDGKDLDEPLEIEAVRSLKYLVVFDRYDLTADLPVESNVEDPNFGNPNFYTLTTNLATAVTKIHHSRLILFHGVPLPRRIRMDNNYWGDSVLCKLYNSLRNYNTSFDSAASIMQDFTVPVFEIENLDDLLCSGQDGVVQTRLALINKTSSITNAIVVKKGENYSRQTTAVSGIKDLLDKMTERLLVASGIPHTILLGESPSGLGATGDSEKRDWFDYVKTQQESILRPALKKIYEIVFASREGPTNGSEPEQWMVEFNSLWQQDDRSKAELRKLIAETDNIYISNGVLDPEEVAESRFGGAEYSIETTLDEAIRDQIRENDTLNEQNELQNNQNELENEVNE